MFKGFNERSRKTAPFFYDVSFRSTATAFRLIPYFCPMNAEDTLKILQIENQIREYLGQDTNHIVNFKYEQRDNLMHVNVETINPRYNQMFLFHTETGTDQLDALQKMFEYVKHYKDRQDSYTIQWSATGEREVRTSYFSGATLEEALAKFRYGRDRNKTTIFLISLNPKA